MTRERREEVILAALVVSIAVHVGLMLLVRPQVMSRSAVTTGAAAKAEPMRVVRSLPKPAPVPVADLLDLRAAKDAPPLREDRVAPQAPAPSVADGGAVRPSAAAAPALRLPDMPVPVFETKISGQKGPEGALPRIVRIETPKAPLGSLPAPSFRAPAPDGLSVPLPAAPSAAAAPGASVLPVALPSREDSPAAFAPAEEVYERVDEKIVAEEKAAVRKIVNARETEDLVRFVNVTMCATVKDGWRYFRVMMTPRSILKVVPKDVVLVIDGSGSIGNDRFGSCRKAARQILRTCTNTGDRFNLVVFRNAFTYAFRKWRACDAPSFEAADRWLSRQTAHGRTDVFSTISSVLTLPRDPARPLIALVVTDGDANCGVSDTSEILSKFTSLNDGLVSVYMYGVKSSANRDLIDVLTHGNRGESLIFDGWRWNVGAGMERLSERFRDPVVSDLRLIFASDVRAEAYPRLLKNLYRGGIGDFVGRVPATATDVAFSLRGAGGAVTYEGFFRLPFATAPEDPSVVAAWQAEAALDRRF